MKIVIVGAGDIGSYLAISLSRAGHQVTVIENDLDLISNLQESIDARLISSDGASAQALAEAEVAGCDLFLSLTKKQTVNLVSASMAKSLGAKMVISRVNPSLQSEEWLFDFRQHFHLDYLFSPEGITALEVAKHIRPRNFLTMEEMARGMFEWQEVKISQDSLAIGKSLKYQEGFNPKFLQVLGVLRAGEKISNPSETFQLKEGDSVCFCGQTAQVRKFSMSLRSKEELQRNLKIIIFGGSSYGLALARVLESWNYQVRIFEKDREICENLAGKLGKMTTVVQTDMTHLEDLEEEQLGNADFFIAMSERDEDNVVMCLQAKSLGVSRCISLIRRADYASSISSQGEELGIAVAISPREAIRQEISHFVLSDRYRYTCESKFGVVLGFPIRHGTIAVGHTVSEIDLPEGVTLLAHLHGASAAIPSSNDVLNAGDFLYVLTSSTKAKENLLKLFL